jgi:short subunit dehydrogenase-like uncharacterized protein
MEMRIFGRTGLDVICPGLGFDVIPTDRLVAVLKEALPDATHLVLAFDAPGPMSPGTPRAPADKGHEDLVGENIP